MRDNGSRTTEASFQKAGSKYIPLTSGFFLTPGQQTHRSQSKQAQTGRFGHFAHHGELAVVVDHRPGDAGGWVVAIGAQIGAQV